MTAEIGGGQARAVGVGRGPGVDAATLGRVRERLVAGGAEPTPARVAAALRDDDRVLGDEELLSVLHTLRSEITGGGPLERLLADSDVTDVLVNGPDQVWIDRGRGLEATGVRFADDAAVRRLATRLATSAGRRLDDAAPFVDARLPSGVRLHAVLPPIAVGATLVSLRVPAESPFTMRRLRGAGTVSDGVARVLTALVAARRSFLVTGGTGSGKTTLLACLLGMMPPTERLVVVEDSTELCPDHPHVVRLQARRPNAEGSGEVTLSVLVRQALRMRPDRLVVGEVRGAEVVDLLAALNTGHEGGCGTIHANSPADLPARVEALGMAAGLPRAAVHSQLAAAVDAVVHLARARDGARVVSEVAVLSRSSQGRVTVERAYDADGRPGPGAPRLDGLLETAVFPA